ncbi:hypothetical protein ABBQ38_013659 [Trebouxia sp. C0009 RCD-2024]
MSLPGTQAIKVVIHLKPTGGAPVLKQLKFKVSGDRSFAFVAETVRKQLQIDSVFLYIKEAFCPSLEEKLSVLAEAYAVDGQLNINYACTPAWG